MSGGLEGEALPRPDKEIQDQISPCNVGYRIYGPVWLSRFGDGLGYSRPEFDPTRRGIIGFGLIIESAGLAISIAIGNHGNPSSQGVGVASAHQPAE